MNELRPEPAAADAGSATAATAAPILTLRQARERAGVHAAALAATLKVPLRQLEALESGRYDELPDLTFARTLALSVCRQLKVDPGPVLAQMPMAGQVRLGESETALHTPMPQEGASVLARAVAAPVQTLSVPVALAVLMLVVALLLWFWLPQQPEPAPLAQPAPLAEPAAPPLAGGPDAAAPAAALPVPSPLTAALPDPGPSAPPLLPTPAEPVPPPVPAPASAPPTPVAAAAVTPTTATAAPLLLRAQQNAWVQVTGASGRVLLQRHLQAGEALGFADDLPLQVVIGRADAVEVSVRGQVQDMAPHSRNNVARLQVR